MGQVVDAINNSSTTTGVNAAYDSATNKIVLSSEADIVATGTDDGTLTSFDVTATDGNATALDKSCRRVSPCEIDAM